MSSNDNHFDAVDRLRALFLADLPQNPDWMEVEMRLQDIKWETLQPLLEAIVVERDQARRALKDMEARKDAAYLERNQVVAALAKSYPSGIAKTAIDGWSEDWHGCVYIDLPTGQASWHYHDSQAYLFQGLPAYEGQWDGHDTPLKYLRVSQLKPWAASIYKQLPGMCDAFRTTISASLNGTGKSRHEMIFTFQSQKELHQAENEWIDAALRADGKPPIYSE